MATILQNILSAIGFSAKESKQDTQITKLGSIETISNSQLSQLTAIVTKLILAPSTEGKQDVSITALNNIIAKLVANPNLESTQLSVLSQLQGLLTFAPSNATIANQKKQIDTDTISSIRGATAPITTTFLNTFNSLLNNNISYFSEVVGNFTTLPIKTGSCSKIVLKIMYESSTGANAVIVISNNFVPFIVNIPFKDINGASVTSVSIARGTFTIITINENLVDDLRIRMVALPIGFIVNTDKISIQTIFKF